MHNDHPGNFAVAGAAPSFQELKGSRAGRVRPTAHRNLPAKEEPSAGGQTRGKPNSAQPCSSQDARRGRREGSIEGRYPVTADRYFLPVCRPTWLSS